MRRVLVTGATGFIGGRLAEILCERGVATVALVRTWMRAARLARLPVELVPGNVLDADSIARAMSGCDVVFHGAVDNRSTGAAHRAVSVTGTANVMQAAAQAGVRRVVHLSSVAVFGYRPHPDAATEAGSCRYTGDDYCDGKIDGEKVAMDMHRRAGVPVVILRPTIVYGPFSEYSRLTAGMIRQGRMVLVNGGQGSCNQLFVDNLVDAMLLAAGSEEAVGEVFHLSDASPITWRDFIEAHARAVDWDRPLPILGAEELNALRRAPRPSPLREVIGLFKIPEVRRRLRALPLLHPSVKAAKAVAGLIGPAAAARRQDPTPGPRGSAAPDPLPAPLVLGEELMLSAFENVVFRIDKARQRLGYAPAVDFAAGMRRTEAWIRWARL